MARTPVNGLVVSIGSTFGATKTMSAITNAASAVLTLEASHGFTVGDTLEIVTSGWPRIQGRVGRVTAVNTNDVTININTQNTTDYPTGTGAGTVREVTAVTNVGQILNDSFQSSGGEVEYQEFQYLDQDDKIKEPTGRSAASIAFTIHDDIAAAGQILLESLSASQVVTPFKFTARDGSIWYGAGRFSMAVAPTFTGNQNVSRGVSIALASPFLTSYKP